MSGKKSSPASLHFRGRNAILLGAAIVSVGVGYLLLAGGDTGLAPILLVVGYCVLFPLSLAL